MTRLRSLHITVVTHEFFKGSGQELKDFLVESKVSETLYIGHIFAYAKNSVSYMEHYLNGDLKKKKQSPKLPANEFLLYARDAFYTLYYIFSSKGKFDYFIGIDSFNALFGLLLKKIGKVDKVVFMTIDYVMHGRFKNKYLNRFYVWMDRKAFYGSDFTWNVSDRMSRQRVLELGESATKKIQLVVPIGVPIDEAEKVQTTRKDNVIVYSGSLSPEFGLELLIESMPHLIAKFPDIELRIIGAGVLEAELKKMVADLKVEKNVNFVGFINTTNERERWLKLLKESTLGLATYEDNETTYKRFSDVTKPKDYMSCGLPLITTSVIPISEDVEKHNLGRVVKYNVESFVEGISDLLSRPDERKQIEKNVYEYSKNMTWENIFKKVFNEMGVSTE